jgi:hypothetical protein
MRMCSGSLRKRSGRTTAAAGLKSVESLSAHVGLVLLPPPFGFSRWWVVVVVVVAVSPARALPHRAPMSVWERARRTLDKNQKKGPWTEEEEQWLIEYPINLLPRLASALPRRSTRGPTSSLMCARRLYEKHGKNYTPIADEMGRWVTSVRDKLRKFESCNGQFLPKDRTKQSWTFEEDCRLIELVPST